MLGSPNGAWGGKVSQFFFILEGFRDQIQIPGEISCPGMVSDPQSLNFLLRPGFSCRMNFFMKNIIQIQTLALQPFHCLGFVESSRFACAHHFSQTCREKY